MDFEEALKNEQSRVEGGGVRVAEVVESDRDFVPVDDPGHPDANEEGYVLMPNVDTTEERIGSDGSFQCLLKPTSQPFRL